MNNFTSVIGLEVHIQLNTKSKIFCSDKNEFGHHQNVNIGEYTLALPGTLPRINSEVIHKAIKLGTSLGCEINEISYFDRKHYIYPDLPKGYQITQDRKPICIGGTFEYQSDNVEKSIRLHHIHIEEDAGKSLHEDDTPNSKIDLNRAGTPLLEMVTEPDFRSAQEVYDFIEALQKWIIYLDISDGNMEEGSLRCDCNVSLNRVGEAFGERCEIKNVNSKKFARQAIDSEINRQSRLLEQNKPIVRSTLHFDPSTGKTTPMREKEAVNDYRYFADPDLPIIKVSKDTIETIKNSIEHTPKTAKELFEKKYRVNEEFAAIIMDDINYVKFFEENANSIQDINEFAGIMALKMIPYSKNKNKNVKSILSKTQILSSINLMNSNTVSKSAFLQVIEQMFDNPDLDAVTLAKQHNLIQAENQDFLDAHITRVIEEYPEKVAEYRKGKKGLIGFFMGQVKKDVGNKADPKILNTKLQQKLDNI